MSEPILISAVKYLNTQPYIYGLENDADLQSWQLSLDTPFECARKLEAGSVDVGLVPVAALPELDHYRSITNWGIGADGTVQSVVLLSDVEINDVSAIYLDYQSRTSNTLLRILLREYYNLELPLLESTPGYEDEIKADVAGLVIGDRALAIRSNFAFRYDLSQAWKEMTGLPFVFARWVGSERVTLEDEIALEKAFKRGLDERFVLADNAKNRFPDVDLQAYLRDHIKFELDSNFWEGLALFQEKQQQLWTFNSLL